MIRFWSFRSCFDSIRFIMRITFPSLFCHSNRMPVAGDDQHIRICKGCVTGIPYNVRCGGHPSVSQCLVRKKSGEKIDKTYLLVRLVRNLDRSKPFVTTIVCCRPNNGSDAFRWRDCDARRSINNNLIKKNGNCSFMQG